MYVGLFISIFFPFFFNMFPFFVFQPSVTHTSVENIVYKTSATYWLLFKQNFYHCNSTVYTFEYSTFLLYILYMLSELFSNKNYAEQTFM